MRRQQITFRAATAAVPRLEALLELAGAESVSLADAGDEPVLEPAHGETPLWPEVVVRALFSEHAQLEPLCRVLEGDDDARHVERSVLRDEDWRDSQLRSFPPREFGRRIWLAPSDARAAPDGRALVKLHMGLAFGTGEHPTTALCLDWLDAHVAENATMLDYGCGSGVLAIASLVLGASRAYAVDNDPQALVATRENAALNGVLERLFIGAPEALPAVEVDIVAANILAGPLQRLAPTLLAHARVGGALALSGLLEAQASAVRAAYEQSCTSFDCTVRHGWALLTAVRAR